MIDNLKRLWYRLNSKTVWPEQVKQGDCLLFDFPGTGPYWTAPVEGTRMMWGRWWGPYNKDILGVWVLFGGGSLFVGIDTGRLRVKR